MPKYVYNEDDAVETGRVKCKGSNLRIHYKNTHEVVAAIKGMKLVKAQKYLRDVIQHKDAIPFRKYTGGIGHHAQAKKHKAVAARWPEKACRHVLDLLTNAAANAEPKGFEAESLYIVHAQTNRAPKLRRRTYRAHGRINKYESSPCHVELILAPRAEPVAKADDSAKRSNKDDGKLVSGEQAF